MQVESILDSKGHGVETIRPDATVEVAAHRMATLRIGCLVVVDERGALQGMVTERDLVRALARDGAAAIQRRVRDVMSTDVPTCRPDHDVAAVMRTMTVRRYRHLPVVRDRRVLGLISIGDLVKHRLEQLEMEASVLREAYLASH